MEICGIIAEYNPFHNGHLAQIQMARSMGATHIIAVMSGNFVQRGDVGIFTKWGRARAALLNGVDLVVCMPSVSSAAPAYDFARAGVFLLSQLGAQTICFGSENVALNKLAEAAKCCQIAQNSVQFQTALKSGKSHLIARETALRAVSKNPDEIIEILRTPNNLLAAEYLRAIEELHVRLKPVCIPRVGAQHDSEDDSTNSSILSASQIRKMILTQGISKIKPYVPKSAYDVYKDEIKNCNAPYTLARANALISYRLRSVTAAELEQIDDITEGLENRILRIGRECASIEECVEKIATKRYTKARIRRIILNFLLEKKKGEFKKLPEYAHILGMNAKGAEVLKFCKKSNCSSNCGEIFISPKFADIAARGFKQAQFESRATDIYSMLGAGIGAVGLEFTQKTIII